MTEGGASPASAGFGEHAGETRGQDPNINVLGAQEKTKGNPPNALASQIIRAVILPEIEKEINEGKNFATLRQIFYAQVLAVWFKRNLKQALLNQVYANKGTVKGIDQNDAATNEAIYHQYLKAYRKGVFNFIQEDIDPVTQETLPRKYFSGGFGDLAQLTIKPERLSDTAMVDAQKDIDFAVVAVQPKDAAMINRRTFLIGGAAGLTAGIVVGFTGKRILDRFSESNNSEQHLPPHQDKFGGLKLEDHLVTDYANFREESAEENGKKVTKRITCEIRVLPDIDVWTKDEQDELYAILVARGHIKYQLVDQLLSRKAIDELPPNKRTQKQKEDLIKAEGKSYKEYFEILKAVMAGSITNVRITPISPKGFEIVIDSAESFFSQLGQGSIEKSKANAAMTTEEWKKVGLTFALAVLAVVAGLQIRKAVGPTLVSIGVSPIPKTPQQIESPVQRPAAPPVSPNITNINELLNSIEDKINDPNSTDLDLSLAKKTLEEMAKYHIYLKPRAVNRAGELLKRLREKLNQRKKLNQQEHPADKAMTNTNRREFFKKVLPWLAVLGLAAGIGYEINESERTDEILKLLAELNNYDDYGKIRQNKTLSERINGLNESAVDVLMKTGKSIPPPGYKNSRRWAIRLLGAIADPNDAKVREFLVVDVINDTSIPRKFDFYDQQEAKNALNDLNSRRALLRKNSPSIDKAMAMDRRQALFILMGATGVVGLVGGYKLKKETDEMAIKKVVRDQITLITDDPVNMDTYFIPIINEKENGVQEVINAADDPSYPIEKRRTAIDILGSEKITDPNDPKAEGRKFLEKVGKNTEGIYSDDLVIKATKALEELDKHKVDKAALSAMRGGIDLSQQDAALRVEKDANGGVKVNVDPALIARVEREGMPEVIPVIINMQPADIRSLFGNPS